MYILTFLDEAVEDIKTLPRSFKNALKKELQEKLAINPHNSMELSEPLKEWRSFHYGDYRIVFRIFEDLKAIAIAGVGKKIPNSESDIYRKLELLANQGKLADTVISTLRTFSTPR